MEPKENPRDFNDLTQGSLYGVLRFRKYIWPPQKPLVLMDTTVKGGRVAVVVGQDGSFEVVITNGQNEVARTRFQRVELSGTGLIFFCVRWSEAGVILDFGKYKLSPFDEAQGAPVALQLKEAEILDGPSFDRPESTMKCAARIQWRNEHFKRLAGVVKLAPGEKLKPLEQQLYELGQSRMALTLQRTLLDNGMGFMGGALATELRALLSVNGKAYNPLLLRLAAAKGLPLPVYVMEEKEFPVPGWISSGPAGGCPIWKTSPAEQLVDLEDWYKSKLSIKKPEAQAEKFGGDRIVRVSDLLDEVANCVGSAHYSLKISDRVEEMFAHRVFGRSAVVEFLCETAASIIVLSGYVLCEHGVLDKADFLKELVQYQPGRRA